MEKLVINLCAVAIICIGTVSCGKSSSAVPGTSPESDAKKYVELISEMEQVSEKLGQGQIEYQEAIKQNEKTDAELKPIMTYYMVGEKASTEEGVRFKKEVDRLQAEREKGDQTSVEPARISNSIEDNSTSGDYKVSIFGESGWYFYTIVNESNITMLCYANQNEYHKSGKPIYILQGTINAPDKKNLMLDDEADPNAGAVRFKTIYSDSNKEDMVPCAECIWYKYNPNGKDRLEEANYEGGLNIYVQK
ncbi:MAG: hypothetical protein LBN93_00505 [Candidatus Symbiothrix sp.]|jgi:hypothetical protein|nr:hypothetical protein [Candidatus Symbiothrix sp.]